jgi:hypothetical protein
MCVLGLLSHDLAKSSSNQYEECEDTDPSGVLRDF